MDMDNLSIEERWREILTERECGERYYRLRRLFRRIPSGPRCKICYVPFGRPGSPLMQILGKGPSNLNPNYCDACDQFARANPGGAEVELTLFFADVRGSTRLAEQMRPGDYGQLINRFYTLATDILGNSDAMIERLAGDQVIGLYVPRHKDHAHRALTAARKLLDATGHNDSAGPWIPLGVGLHTGEAFVGAVGREDGLVNVTALGDTVNVAARLSSRAGIGEILVTESTAKEAGLHTAGLERRHLELKGRMEPVDVWVLSMLPQPVVELQQRS